ncbi:EndoU domain-containing protein [Bacillus cabrialesii]|uniref:EndoU domain-containing protein n=1 Tax=Bacillus cabrialesii TaxID=2487276 RepID=UPI001C0569E9|nr:EndoU domain-containing protein [Bacillus cabrialesii]MBU2660192.1 EndoU domain-containing protein [Bacillus cabrialesii]
MINSCGKAYINSFIKNKNDLALAEAYKNKKQIRDNKYIGKTSSGVDVEMYINKNGSIATAYPLYKKPKE